MRTGLRFLTSKFPKTGSEMPLHDTEIMLLSWQAPQEFFGAARICFHALCFLSHERGFMMTGDWPGEIDRAISHVGRLHRFSDQRSAKKRLLCRSTPSSRCRAHLAFASWSLPLAPTQRSAPGEAPGGSAGSVREDARAGVGPRRDGSRASVESRGGALAARRR